MILAATFDGSGGRVMNNKRLQIQNKILWVPGVDRILFDVVTLENIVWRQSDSETRYV